MGLKYTHTIYIQAHTIHVHIRIHIQMKLRYGDSRSTQLNIEVVSAPMGLKYKDFFTSVTSNGARCVLLYV